MEMQIIELVERCQTGERKAMEQLVVQIQNDIYYHCKKMLRSEEDAKDATQEILITILTKLPELKTPAAFHGWMSTITYNRCVNMVTRRKREEQIPEDDDGKDLLETYETMDEQVLPDKALDTAEMRRMIAELVDELPELQRMTVLFYYFDELSVKDIAQAMGTSEGTVKSRLNYARKAIKEGVEKYEKQGIKLCGISPLPFLLYFLRTDAKASGLNRADAAAMLQSVVNGTVEGTVTGAVSGGAASATAGAEAASASMASGVVAGAAKIGFSLGTKVLAGVIAAATAIGGLTVGIASQINDRPLSEPTMSDETMAIPSQIRYAQFYDVLEILRQSGYDGDEFGQYYGRFALEDVDGDNEDELLAVLTREGMYIEAHVYDVDRAGQLSELISLGDDDRYLNVGYGSLSLGMVDFDGEEYFSAFHIHGEEVFEHKEYILYAKSNGKLEQTHVLSCDEHGELFGLSVTERVAKLDSEEIESERFYDAHESYRVLAEDKASFPIEDGELVKKWAGMSFEACEMTCVEQMRF